MQILDIMFIIPNPGAQRWPVRPLFLTLAVLAVVMVGGCGRETRDDDRGPEALYEEAQRALASRNYQRSIEIYRNLTTRYPFGRHAEQSQLDMAFAMQRAGRGEAALTTLDRFIRTYPTHPNIDYARYLKGLVHYDAAMGFLRRLFPGQIVDRDQDNARRSFDAFQELVQLHPQSRYVADARQRMVYLRNVLAEYEMTVGEYYFRRGAYVAAISRARFLIENYPQAPANIDALQLMERSYRQLSLTELADDTRLLLESNYGDDIEKQDDRPSFWARLWPFD